MSAVREMAEAGDAVAEYEVGRSMLGPTPTDYEVAAAMPWFRRSAEQGYASAEYIYGDMFREGRWKNPQQLVYWWTKAAEQGEVRAQLWLGVFYEHGQNGVERDYLQAFKWLSMAAKQGQPDGQVTLGQMYEDGEGIPQDYLLAAYWYRKAGAYVPDLGGAGAGLNSVAHPEGHATQEDYVFVYVWFAVAGDADGLRNVTKKMNTNQLTEAQRRTIGWFHPRFSLLIGNGQRRGCLPTAIDSSHRCRNQAVTLRTPVVSAIAIYRQLCRRASTNSAHRAGERRDALKC
jgi:TPR repeat protein